MSKVQDIASQESFQSHVASLSPKTLLVVSFHAPWAAPCAQMRTVLETLASTYEPTDPPRITFLSIDAEALPEISESYDVTAVPFLVLQQDGKTLESVSGSDAVKVRNAIERHYFDPDVESKKVSLPPKLEVRERFDQRPDFPTISESVRNRDQKAASSTATTSGPSENGVATFTTKNLSSYAPTSADPSTAPAMSGAADLSSTEANPASEADKSQDELNARLASLVKAAPVMLFMKGTPSAPQCGFSRQLVGILRERGVRYGFFNILADEDVRQGLKAFADWPTYPQLWMSGELVGGLDIVSVILPLLAGLNAFFYFSPSARA